MTAFHSPITAFRHVTRPHPSAPPPKLARSTAAAIIAVIFLFSASSTVFSHPSSGIVVNELGEVLFVHSTRGLAKVQRDGKLTYVHESTGGHWLCLDRQGHFSHTQPKHF